ncbi:hypothetical protein Tco_1333102, partial [Tanacetum coccineum]
MLEEALRLQEQLDEEERQRIAKVHEEASTFNDEEWDNIQAQIEADEELVYRLQAQERERYSEADKARLLVELINERAKQKKEQAHESSSTKDLHISSKIDDEQELNQESSKRQKIGEGSEPAEESKDKL